MKNKIKYVIGIIICLVIVLFGGNKILEQETVDNIDNQKNDFYALVDSFLQQVLLLALFQRAGNWDTETNLLCNVLLLAVSQHWTTDSGL